MTVSIRAQSAESLFHTLPGQGDHGKLPGLQTGKRLRWVDPVASLEIEEPQFLMPAPRKPWVHPSHVLDPVPSVLRPDAIVHQFDP